MSFAKEALPFVLPPGLAAALLLAAGAPVLALVAAVVALLVLLFFRVPARRSQAGPEEVLAPANGLVTAVERAEDPEVAEGPLQRIVTFLSVFDVHVQRSPVAGEVVATSHRRGRKVAAFRRDAGDVNECFLTVIERPDGRRIGVRQIAGLLARRVVAYGERGRRFDRGELLGIIKFGSRVDLLLPADLEVTVRPGDRLVEGLTAVARPPRPAAPPSA